MRILAFLGVLWLLRLLIGALAGKAIKSNRSGPETVRTKTVKDPVCGMYMDPRLAIQHQEQAGTIYFCSETCRDQYLKDTSVRGQ